MPAHTSDIIAFDRISLRHFDVDKRLHVEKCNISKACVNPYLGREIPNSEALGLDPTKIYMLLRDPAELAAAAPTFNNLQLLMTHIGVNASEPQLELTVGTIGSDVNFEAPYLQASIAVWTEEAIKLIESKAQAQLSCSYRYRADMTPGTYEGVAYDGVMRDIRGNHVALVEEGRAGSDVFVSDSLPSELRTMFKFPKLIAALKAFAPTATNDQLTAFDAAMTEEMEAKDADLTPEEKKKAEDEYRKSMDKAADASLSDEEKSEAWGKAKDKKRRARDGNPDPESTNSNARAGDAVVAGPREGEVGAALDAALKAGKFISKADADTLAADAAKRASNDAVTRINALHKAREDVKPLVGVVAFDSAEAVYAFALKECKIPTEGVPSAAYGALVAAELRNRQNVVSITPRLAADAVTAVGAAVPGLARFHG
jgi:uncharacterized protein